MIPDWLYLLLLTLVFVLVFLAPIALAYIKGAKDIGKTLTLYSKVTEKSLGKFSNARIVQRGLKGNLDLIYKVELKDGTSIANMEIEFSLIERRTYVYYLYKIFKTLPDIFIIRVNMDRKPSTSLVIIPRKKRKIISKIMKYLSQLQEIRVKKLSNEIMFSSDDSRYGSRYLSKRVLEIVYDLRHSLNFIFVDYNPPHIEINCEITNKNANRLIKLAIELSILLSKGVREIRVPGRKTEALKFMRRSLEPIH